MLLLEPGESRAPLPRSDRRWTHLKKVLRKGPGDRVCAGIVDGPIGSAEILRLDDEGLVLEFQAEREAPPLAPLTLVLGFPRPIQAGRILRDLASLGVAQIELTGTELGEKSYQQSDFFTKGDFRSHLIEGAEQAGNPRLPRVRTHWTLKRCIDALGDSSGGPSEAVCSGRFLLHPYGAARRMGLLEGLEPPVVLAIGSERGWTEPELRLLTEAGFLPISLGERILRTETAALLAASLALSRMGYM